MISSAEPRRIGIWGLGREGRAALDFLAEKYPDAQITGLNDAEGENLPGGHALLSGEKAREAIAGGEFELIVKSPGVPLRRPEIAAARAKGTRFTSATNLWFEHRRAGPVIGITGTKGKSTISLLLLNILLAAGVRAKLLGNTGFPAIAEPAGEDVTLLELSSYQIADLEHGPDMVVFNNLYPEHVPWHGSIERYYADKLRLVSLNPDAQVIANRTEGRLCEHLKSMLADDGRIRWFNADSGYAGDAAGLRYRGQDVRLTGAVPRGAHNLSNLAAAASAALAFGAIADPLAVDIGRFRQLPHRLEEFALARGITGVDDSIATVPEAAMAALEVYDGRPIQVVLGGSDRGQDFGALAATMATRSVAAACLLPETTERLFAAIAASAPDLSVHRCADLEIAIARIAEDVGDGAVILLSPAAPSFVQFANFEERGARFRALCTRMIGTPG